MPDSDENVKDIDPRTKRVVVYVTIWAVLVTINTVWGYVDALLSLT